jgi:hypothetical protein
MRNVVVIDNVAFSTELDGVAGLDIGSFAPQKRPNPRIRPIDARDIGCLRWSDKPKERL